MIAHFRKDNIPYIVSAFVIILMAFLGVMKAADDTTAPEITNVKIINVNDSGATITWKTDEPSDSMINYSLDKSYGIERDPIADKTTHELILDTLDPSTTYHFRIVSADVDGNQGISGDFIIITQGVKNIPDIEKIKDPEQKALTEKAIETIDKIEDPAGMELVSRELLERIKGITDQLTIIGKPEVEPESTRAIVRWKTDRPSDSTVVFVSEDEYNAGDANPYTYSQNSTEGETEEHEVELIGLDPFTKYHFQVISKDKLGITGKSLDATFTTKATLPEIRNLTLLKVEEVAATFNWETTVPSSALIKYENLDTGERFSKGNPTLTSEHTLRLEDLILGSRYRAVIVAENEGGDRVESEAIEFLTIRDIKPPIIAKVTNESTLYPGSDAKIQTLVGWQTDEPSKCVFNFREGISPGNKELELPPQDDKYLEKHIQVIVDFMPATVYKFWIKCKDSSGNDSKSPDFVLFTPEKEKSIIDIIIENFSSAFGWLKEIGK